MARTSKFERLRRHIRDEYLREGYSRSRADYIARATAGEIAHRKQGRRRSR
jgi:hypothetical protein